MKNRRIAALIFVLIICTTLFQFKAQAKTVITNPSGVSGSNYSSTYAAKLDNIFRGNVALFSNTTAKFALGQSLNVDKQYTVAGALSGYQCYIYANAVYYYLFGDLPYHGSGLNGYWSNSTTVLNNQASASYSSFQSAGVGFGAYIRTTGNSNGSYNGSVGHSMIVLSYDSSTITYLDCNSNGAGLVRVAVESWSEFNASHVTGKGRRISHVVQCNSVPKYANLGDSFTAPILNYAAWKPIENSYTLGEKPPVKIQPENGKANQLWLFERQSDGSYIISSCHDGKCLDVRDAYTGTGATIQTCERNNTDAQRWYLYEKNGGYVIQSKLSGYVISLVNNNSTSGNTLQTSQRNDSSAQIWAVYRGTECIMKGPTLSVKAETDDKKTTFSWNDVYGEREYNVRIWKDKCWEGDDVYSGWNVSSGWGVQLPEGNYQAYVDAVNHFDFEMGNIVSFTVKKHTHTYSYKVTKTPTTSATGTLTGTCSRCNGTTTVTLPKLNTTDYSYKVTKAATCTATGTGRYTWKTTSYGSFGFDVSIASKGHSYTIKVTAPTCTAQGYTTHTCSACGNSYKDTYVSATGHSYGYKVTKTPTTSATGTLTGTCSRCNGTTTVTLPKLNTTDYSYKVTKAATCTATGTGRYTWKTTSYGSFGFDVSIASKGHSYTIKVTAPTCTAQGYTTHTCSVCGNSYKDTYVSATGHSFSFGVCSVCGEKDPDYSVPVVPVSGSVTRVFGSTRYDTAFDTANYLKELRGIEKFDCIVVASGEDFADALSGSYLANQKNAPILLVKNRNKEINAVKDYIKANLNPGGTVYLLGGEKAVPKAMETGLDGFNVKRLAGATRYDTNLAILKEAGIGNRDILVCTGKNFADGLSASAVNKPVLLVKDSLTSAQKELLSTANGGKIYVIGGTNAVNAKIESALTAYGSVTRLSGADRYQTSVAIATTFFGGADSAVLVYGLNFPDGLSGGSLAYSLNAPLILTANGKQSIAKGYTSANGITSGAVLGGSGLISDKVVKDIFSMSSGDQIIVK